jgi:N-acetylmuramoyl-L-alanine amidase
MRKITHIVIHCSATPEGRPHTAADIERWHRELGWASIGYHYVIRLDGTVELGRPVSQAGAHVSGHNATTIGICYVGGLDRTTWQPKDTRTEEQKRSMRTLVVALKGVFPDAEVLGHRDFPNVRKACPCFDVRRWWESVQ